MSGLPKSWVSGFLRRYDAQDRALVAGGFPATSPWWRAEIDRFLRSGCRRWVIRAGRRAGKSSTLCRLAVCWALYGGWSVPPGDVGVIPFVSVDRDEAGARLRTIADILRALGAVFEQRGDELELTDRRLVFRVATCSIRGTVGFTSVAVFGDEMAKWESRDTAANPAADVMASLRPTMATQPLAFEVCSSSPWSLDDYHAQLFDDSDTAHQAVSFAPTWVANPTITEARTFELEPDERTRLREYGAIPGNTLSSAFESIDVIGCFRPPAGGPESLFLVTDASSLRGDTFAYIAGATVAGGGIHIDEIDGWSDTELRASSMTQVVDALVARANEIGVREIFGDQREEASLTAMFAERGMAFHSIAWTESSKDSAVQTLRRMMRERQLTIVEHAKTRSELIALKARLQPSGRVKYLSNGLDFASCLITLAHALNENRIYGSTLDIDDFLNFNAQIHAAMPASWVGKWT